MAASTGYVVMTYARCGATWLAELAGSTDCLGRPEDWFNGTGYRNRGVADYPLEREQQLARVLTHGASPNGVYAVKLSAGRCDALRGFDWMQRLAPCKFIHLVREDRLARAISDVKSQQTGQYRSTSPAQREPHYDRQAIRAALAQQAIDEARIRQFFALNAIVPLELTYEALFADPKTALKRMAELLNIAEVPHIDPTQIFLAPQADGTSLDWAERFLMEQGFSGTLPILRDGRRWRDIIRGR